MKLENIIGKCMIAALAFSPLITGCEDPNEKPKQDKEVAEGHAAVYGTWYKKEEGTTSSGWRWNWAHLFLEQNGTNIFGYYRLEAYGNEKVQGYVNINRIHLDSVESDGTIRSMFDGSVNGNNLALSRSGPDGGTFTRISEDIDEEYCQ